MRHKKATPSAVAAAIDIDHRRASISTRPPTWSNSLRTSNQIISKSVAVERGSQRTLTSPAW
jgi:hypothetical protein